MPCKKPVHPLTKLCLHNIAVHFDSLWCRVDKKQDWDMAYDLGPFVNLPGNLLYELIEYLKRRNFLRRHHLHYLIQSKIEKLNLSTGIGDIYFALRFVVDRCKWLRHLDLSYQNQVAPGIITEAMCFLPCLRELNLQKTMCTDSTLREIGRNCRQLLSLNLSMCYITDTGIFCLCLDSTYQPQCQSLVRLSILETSVTRQGAVLVLQSLPNLRDFKFDDLYLAFKDLAILDGGQHTYKLASVSTGEFVFPACLSAIVKLCPHLQQLSLLHADLLQGCLGEIAKLEYLSELCLGNGRGTSISFDAILEYCLEPLGKQLRKLHLHDLASVDIDDVDRTCPNLRHFCITSIGCFVPVPPAISDATFFPNLIRLEISCIAERDLPANVLQRLLGQNPNIQDLRLKRCRCADDDFLSKILLPVKTLTRLRFEECFGITSTFLLNLICADNILDSLIIWTCPAVSQNDYEMLMDAVQEFNIDMHLDYLGDGRY